MRCRGYRLGSQGLHLQARKFELKNAGLKRLGLTLGKGWAGRTISLFDGMCIGLPNGAGGGNFDVSTVEGRGLEVNLASGSRFLVRSKRLGSSTITAGCPLEIMDELRRFKGNGQVPGLLCV